LPLVADVHIVETLSEIGVILLMFSLGLEFRLRRLVQLGPTAGFTALVQCSMMLWLGFVIGRAFGFTVRESVFTGAIVAISSTTIIAKAFEEQGIRGRLRELVVGVLIVEDLIAVVLVAVLTATASRHSVSAATLLESVGKLTAFLLFVIAAGMLIVPRLMRAVVWLGRPETTLVTSIGVCFAVALFALKCGYSVALGAFIAGSLVAESGETHAIERLVQPVRDMFAAVFFVSVGMQLDPALVVHHLGAVVALTAAVIFGKIVSVGTGAFLTGNGTRTSIQAGMSLAQIGEFSFIIAGLGVSLGATRSFLYPAAVAVSALTTLATPWLIRASEPVARWFDRALPAPLQTFAALYGSWLERLGSAPRRGTLGASVRRMLKLLLLDGAALIGIAIFMSTRLDRSVALVADALMIEDGFARAIVVAVALAVALPFCIGIVRVARRLGSSLAIAALPASFGSALDLAAAPRRALVVTLQLAIVLAVGLPLVALTQPFASGPQLAIALGLLLGVLGWAFWRSATNLEGHVRAGAQMIVEALARQAEASPPFEIDGPSERALSKVNELLPGLGEPTPLRLTDHSAAVGRTLADLNLRGNTGATVLAVVRGEDGVIIPTAKQRLCSGDVLALAGTHDAIEAARGVLETGAIGMACTLDPNSVE
jgi:CPA2 family monovalent cation:H+ antiporter-2